MPHLGCEAMISCPYCSAENLPDAVFCCKCGKRIQWRPRAPLSRLLRSILIGLGITTIAICALAAFLVARRFTGTQQPNILVKATSTPLATSISTRMTVPTSRPTATLTPKQRITAYYPIDPRDLARNPQGFVGQKAKVFGQVFDISESAGETILQIMSCPSQYEYEGYAFRDSPKSCEYAFERQEPLVVFYPGRADDLYKDYWIAVYGYVSVPMSGSNAWGVEVTRPTISADYLLYPLGRDDLVMTDW
jgi:hypothetical protein